ncbi:MAG: glycine--tRNA ligase subunit beta [Thermodesulfobacteriota bacterium]
MADLLFEIGIEELPAGFLQPALDQLRGDFCKKATEHRLEHGSVSVMGTPRRLSLIVQSLAESQPDGSETLMGPSKKAGFDEDGNPTRAALGFAGSKGVDVSELKVAQTEKGEYLMLVREIKGSATYDLLPDLLVDLLLGLSFPKSMKWGGNQNSFARPIQWLVALYDEKIVPFELEGIKSGRQSRGHRFLAPEAIDISTAADYEAQLDGASVIVDVKRRREMVITEIRQAVVDRSLPSGAEVAIDEGLVDTVCNLVEHPFGICGSFDSRFLELPDQVLITSMREHQKYFPVVDVNGDLMANFVAVNNTRVKDPDLTRAGHERVLRARLEDAFFFFSSDKQTSLGDRYDDLSGIIFQSRLGTMLEKSERIVKLSAILAEKFAPAEKELVSRAAKLCKIDLLTDMVGEFPSLQGEMGTAYAVHDNEPALVCEGIREHYLPKRAGAELPISVVGALVGLADRIDSIAGCFGIGQIPTGTADPFGLRRLSLAVIHILEKFDYSLSLSEIFHKALALYGDKVDGGSDTVESVTGFIRGRFINDEVGMGRDPEAVEAATAVDFDDINDCRKRVKALEQVRREDAFGVLAAAFKRIRNIIKDNRDRELQPGLFTETAEKELAGVYEQVAEKVAPLIEARNYSQALEEMLVLKAPVDSFFDSVMVMAEDEKVRQNRLNLLTGIGALFLEVGDISKMSTS